jgi:hypothetical protein
MDVIALGARKTRGIATPERAQEFLDRVGAAQRIEAPTVGVGRYAVLQGAVIGGELRDDTGPVHLSAFPPASTGRGAERLHVMEDPIAPPSRRRRID